MIMTNFKYDSIGMVLLEIKFVLLFLEWLKKSDEITGISLMAVNHFVWLNINRWVFAGMRNLSI